MKYHIISLRKDDIVIILILNVLLKYEPFHTR